MKGSGQAYTLGLILFLFDLFINDTFVAEVHDLSITNSGYIGFGLAYDPHGKASFANLNMYNL